LLTKSKTKSYIESRKVLSQLRFTDIRKTKRQSSFQCPEHAREGKTSSKHKNINWQKVITIKPLILAQNILQLLGVYTEPPYSRNV